MVSSTLGTFFSFWHYTEPCSLLDLLNDLDRLDEDFFGQGGEDGGDLDSEKISDTDTLQVVEEEDVDQIESEVEELSFSDTDEDSETKAPHNVDTVMSGEGKEGKSPTFHASRADLSDLENGEASSKHYIPPALRLVSAHAIPASDSETYAQDPQLRRLLLGLLNRLSPTSFPTLVVSAADSSSLHSIYLRTSRAVISKLLIALLLEIIAAQGEGIGDTQVVVLSALAKVLSTGLVGGMASSGGKEFAANLIYGVVKGIDAKGGESDDKERLNLVGFVAMLYNFQVIACNLVYDVVKELIHNGLKEQDVEALLRILKGAFLSHGKTI